MDKETLEGLAALVNVKAEDVAELYEGDGEDIKLKEGVNPLEITSGWIKTRLDDVYKAAQRKTAAKFENFVQSQGFESEAQGVELLQQYVESIKAKPGDGGGGDPGEWEQKYQALESSHAKALEAIKQKEAEVEQAIKEGQRREVAARFQMDVRKALGDKWAGSEDHFGILINNFNLDRIKYDNGKPVLLDESGEVLKDELHRPIEFADMVKKYGGLIGGFHAVDPGKGGPPASGGNGNSGGGSVKIPSGTTEKEFRSMLTNERDPAKRKALLDARIAQIEGDKA